LPEFEHDNCGAGFICNLNGIKSNDIIHKALDILIKLEIGAVSADGRTGDGAGILFDIPHDFFLKKYVILISQKQNMVGMVSCQKKPSCFLQNHFETSIKDKILEF
jgi:glutamate synthase (ferredoxin)